MRRAFAAAWHALDPAYRRCLELAQASLAAGGLAVGAVLTDPGGVIVAEGRNRAYDPPGGRDVLQGTPLAHAELNVLAAVPTARDLSAGTLWSSQQPCSMCSAAAAFCRVGTVRFIAPDPWALAVRATSTGTADGPADDLWVVAANLLFLLSVAIPRGLEHSTVVRNREIEPETAELVVDLVSSRSAALGARSVTELLDGVWDRIVPAAAARGGRLA